jgi:uncharacterized protein (DUF1501 family)
MRRRDFLKNSILASGMLLVPDFVKAAEQLIRLDKDRRKRLVIVQLSGGNDGLNTLIQFRNDLYYKSRPQLAVSPQEVLNLNDDCGFHSSMLGFKKLYDEGLLSIINQVGYPDPDRSHFRSMDIWHTASASDEFLSTGWLGRYLDRYCQSSREIIVVDEMLNLAVKGVERKGLAVRDPESFYNLTREPFFKDLADDTFEKPHSHDQLAYLYKSMNETYASADYIFEKYKAGKNQVEYPQHGVGKDLRQVAQMISGKNDARVFYVSQSGYDTHINQKGTQSRLLSELSDGLYAFVDDLRKMQELDDTLIMVFSEFGRRVEQNASAGTDHGTANQVYLIGSQLKRKGLYNALPDLQHLDEQGDLKFEIDFRSIYASLLSDWLNGSQDLISAQIQNAEILR